MGPARRRATPALSKSGKGQRTTKSLCKIRPRVTCDRAKSRLPAAERQGMLASSTRGKSMVFRKIQNSTTGVSSTGESLLPAADAGAVSASSTAEWRVCWLQGPRAVAQQQQDGGWPVWAATAGAPESDVHVLGKGRRRAGSRPRRRIWLGL